mgnify:CR=1 FL=1
MTLTHRHQFPHLLRALSVLKKSKTHTDFLGSGLCPARAGSRDMDGSDLISALLLGQGGGGGCGVENKCSERIQPEGKIERLLAVSKQALLWGQGC